MTIKHINSGVYFEYIRTFLPQFSTQKFVELLNLKSNKVERFTENTYMNYFEIVEDWNSRNTSERIERLRTLINNLNEWKHL